MNAQKFTQKSLETIQLANNLALENNNMQIEQEHLLYALLKIDQSLIAQLLKKMGKDPQAFMQAVKQEIDKMPGVTGSGREAGKIYIAQDVDMVLAKAGKDCGFDEGRICFGRTPDDFADGKSKSAPQRAVQAV